MDIREMHIELDMTIDEIMSKNVQVLLPKQKDWLLNVANLIFIENRISPKSNKKQEGAYQTVKRYDDLESITISDFELDIYNINNHRVSFQLPYDYLHLVNDRSNVLYNCGRKVDYLNNLDTRQLYITVLPLADDSNNYKLLTITYTPPSPAPAYQVFTGTNYSFGGNGFNSTKEKFELIDIITNDINSNYPNSLNQYPIVFWENFNGVNYNNSFVFVTDTPGYFTIVTDDGSGGTNTQIIAASNVDFNILNSTFANTIQKTRQSHNRLVEKQDLYDILDNTLVTTKPESPVTDLSKRLLYVNTNDKFVVTKCTIDYIRKPARMSLADNINCELAEHTHKEIVDIAARRYKALKDGQYPTHVAESLIIE